MSLKLALVVWCAVAMMFGACVVGDDPVADETSNGEDPDDKADRNAASANCGRFTSASWHAPSACRCQGPKGETTYTNAEGQVVPITCEDSTLQACPSTSGVGCAFSGVGQTLVKAPESAQDQVTRALGMPPLNGRCARRRDG